jgi:hypothetical protein
LDLKRGAGLSQTTFEREKHALVRGIPLPTFGLELFGLRLDLHRKGINQIGQQVAPGWTTGHQCTVTLLSVV